MNMREMAISAPKTDGLPVSMPRTSTSMLNTYGTFIHLTDSRNETGVESNRARSAPLLYGTADQNVGKNGLSRINPNLVKMKKERLLARCHQNKFQIISHPEEQERMNPK